MKRQPLLSATVVGLATWFSAAICPVLAQQPSGNAAFGPPQQVARGGDRMAAGTGLAVAPAAPAPLAPNWMPLTPNHQQYLDQLLTYWEQKSSQTTRYRCTFKRWEYDPVFGPKETFKTYSEGVIKYSAPDKGLFRVDTLLEYQPARNPGDKPTYDPPKEPTGSFDHWICDGMRVYQFDQRHKKLIQNELPPEVRGQAIGNGPLPFLFNAKADDIKRRFWLRIVTPKDIQKEYWLEAVPKTQEDAANFKMIHIIIDEVDYLPKAMVLFDTGYVAVVRPARTTFQFNDREVNFSILAEQLNLFHREFYEPKLPAGWTREVIRAGQAPMPSPDSAVGSVSARNANAARR
jgi:TIGR03009 family protein